MINLDIDIRPTGRTGAFTVLVDGEDVGIVVRTDADMWRSGGWGSPTQDAAIYARALRRNRPVRGERP